ncbi:inactive phospholipase C-like protein 1 isoform X1 [Portunus trituberculatus]|uniref:inactive phospholipase C-like protein 1 isoform X1 n=1 Tax=Portunus trituberculatus TaxID=210409 RepID=UPI001E1CFCE4|nr:inactive phospholipase C-like protein 1 isoform X1 [Portunus trituberculatus]XP_045102898.1 inactive phospholipase C-like protein 1 isoform X1 [Portunus trituberculatus]XP_045102899.1 inactive phospholipase C-like protein 1 isoform X1 [Portunus trituberculatus]XP_045102900.1 inactive phospholipase C-like protein 1 isoform X1 [Portunus trituberculatus]
MGDSSRSPTPEAGGGGDGECLHSDRNGRAGSPGEEFPRSPSPRYRRYSDSTPTRSPSPLLLADGYDELETRSSRKTKSVSFHSHTNWKSDRKIQSAYDCLQYMIEGSSMVKLRANSRQYHRFFRLLDDLSAIRWTPTTKKTSKAQLMIEQIKEIRTGRNCESLRNKDFPVSYNEERIFSILYGDSYESLDLIAHNPEEASIWVTGLNALIGASKATPDAVEDRQTLREMWLKEMFEKASKNNSGGFIDQTTCIKLIKRLDSHVALVRVRQKLQEYDMGKTDGCRGRIDSQEFIDMFKEIATRPEIYFLLIRYANKDYLTLEDFHLFLEGEQGMAGLTTEKVIETIEKYEPAPEARKNRQMLIDGFTRYLMSEECDLFDPAHRVVCQDMAQPLVHYFVSTSHNTYLLEDQLKGPSSVDGYIRVLACGCRCVKVDVWDGQEEPLVYHGNTLTSKIPFREVIHAIATYSFDFSVYPVVVHLENHCSVKQQKVMARLLKSLLGSYLYVHPPDSPKPLTELSPEDLKYKIILKGKKLAREDQDEGEVSEEDEGGETKRNTNPKKIKLCKELSSLISLQRSRFTDLNTARNKQDVSEMCSLSESTSNKLAHTCPEELVNHNKKFLTRVYPNSSRVDSSNYNPQDFWNAGCQMVALNFQTPGQFMDVYEGRFRANGGCGYLLKPAVMREHISVFSAHSREIIPGVAPQLLKIKVISGQCLPKPRGSTATKASFIDPYVVIQVFGIPADCTEAKTRTVSNDSSFPIFDESFEFQINLPELALVRFVVLDDDFIGDDFVGQCTIPLDCIQTGYRHMRLLSSMGEPIESATLFVHVSISNKKGGGKLQRVKGKKTDKVKADIKPIGLKVADDLFKEASVPLVEAECVQDKVEDAWMELQDECGLEHTANMKQCLRVTISRYMATPDTARLSIQEENGVPFLRSSRPVPLPSHLHRLEIALQKVLLEIHHFLAHEEELVSALESCLKPCLAMYDSLESHLSSNGIKGKKANRAMENYAWNVRIIRGQLDRLTTLTKKCRMAMEQVESTKTTLDSLNQRERSPLVRERPRLTLANRHNTTDNLTTYGSLGRSPTTPGADCKPKSILKKSNSNLESSSVGYVNEEAAGSPSSSRAVMGDEEEGDEDDQLLKPPLLQSFSYTPTFTYEQDTAL